MAGVSSDKEMPDFMVGTCLSMCPNEEIRLRQREALVHSLEMAVGANGEKLKYGNPRLMVKEFSRSAAGHEIKPSHIRPLPVLAKTVKFLLTNSCCRTDVPWVLIYQFINDRLRAVRQDLCVQGVKNLECVKLHLSAIRFYVYAHYRTCEHGLADFDPYLNKKSLMETLTMVLSLYRDLEEEKEETLGNSGESHFESEENWPEEEEEGGSEEDVSESKIQKDAQTNEKNCSEEEEATAAQDLYQNLEDLHLEGKQMGEGDASAHTDHPVVDGLLTQSASSDTRRESSENYKDVENYTVREEAEALYILVNFASDEALSHALGLPKSIRCSPLVSLVVEMNTVWLTHNYCRVLHLSSFLPPLFVCAFHPHIAVIERKGLSILSRSHSCKGQLYDKDDLAKSLFFSDAQSMAEACTHYGIPLTEAGVSFNKGSFKADAPMRKVGRLPWIEEKLDKVELSKLLIPQDYQDEDLCSESEETEVCDGNFSSDEEAVPPATPEMAQLLDLDIESNFLMADAPSMDDIGRKDVPTLPGETGNDILTELCRSSTPEGSRVCSLECSAQSDSDKDSAEISETNLRRRKRREEREAMGKKVKAMVEKQRANENWLEKKNLYKPIGICAAFILLGVGSGILLYHYLNV